MSREMLFKAKRLDSGEWVEGSLISTEDNSGFILRSKTKAFIPKGTNTFCSTECYEIDQTTLCQYTGLTDKNGKRIWENDILCGYLDDEYPENRTLKKVIWNTGGFYTKEECSTDFEPLDEFDTEYFEVCGNIFDNPELLEVE